MKTIRQITTLAALLLVTLVELSESRFMPAIGGDTMMGRRCQC